MVVLDTDHLSIIERGGSASLTLELRLGELSNDQIATTVVNYEEQMRGWLAYANRSTSLDKLLESYKRLSTHIETFQDFRILPFDAYAAERLDELYRSGIRVGTMDRRIAAIALANDATVLTRNLSDFQRIPGLIVEDWSS